MRNEIDAFEAGYLAALEAVRNQVRISEFFGAEDDEVAEYTSCTDICTHKRIMGDAIDRFAAATPSPAPSNPVLFPEDWEEAVGSTSLPTS